MSKSLLFWLFLGVVAAGVIVYVAVGMNKEESPADDGEVGGIGTVCTQEAKLCPDGSEVGRVPPSCNFAPCPGGERVPAPEPTPEPTPTPVPPRDGY